MAIWPTKPVTNAADTSLDQNPGTLPNLYESIQNWFQLLTFTKIAKSVVNFNLVETQTQVQFQGVLQPFSAQQLKMMPEGQRLWKWYKIISWPVLSLVPDDILIDQSGTPYRVMAKTDYTAYGYIEYDAIQDYTVTIAPPKPFDPGQLSGLTLWLDASNVASVNQSGGFVSQWTDLGPAHATFVQAAPGLQPAYVASAINGAPAVSFSNATSGKGCLVDTDGTMFVDSGNTPFTLWAVVKGQTSGFSVITTFHAAGGGRDPQLSFQVGSASYQNLYFGDSESGGNFGVARSQTSFDASGSGSAFIITVAYTGSPGHANYAMYSSNVAQTVLPGGTAGQTIPNTVLGANDTAGNDPLLYLSEMAIYDRVLTTLELAQLQNYGFNKYGI